MNGWDYFKRAMTVDYANFTGRARRSEYWYFSLFLSLIAIVLTLICFVLFDAGGGDSLFIWAPIGVLALGVIIPSISVSVRRLHDTGNSGWLYLLSLIPYIGNFIMIIFGCIDSQSGPNKWGPNPKGIGNAYDDDMNISDHLIDGELV